MVIKNVQYTPGYNIVDIVETDTEGNENESRVLVSPTDNVIKISYVHMTVPLTTVEALELDRVVTSLSYKTIFRNV